MSIVRQRRHDGLLPDRVSDGSMCSKTLVVIVAMWERTLPALFVISGMALCASSSSAQNSQYIGAQACGVCHPVQLKLQSDSAHSKSLYPASEHPLAPSFSPSKQFLRRPNFQFQLFASGNTIRVRTSDNKDVM